MVKLRDLASVSGRRSLMGQADPAVFLLDADVAATAVASIGGPASLRALGPADKSAGQMSLYRDRAVGGHAAARTRTGRAALGGAAMHGGAAGAGLDAAAAFSSIADAAAPGIGAASLDPWTAAPEVTGANGVGAGWDFGTAAGAQAGPGAPLSVMALGEGGAFVTDDQDGRALAMLANPALAGGEDLGGRSAGGSPVLIQPTGEQVDFSSGQESITGSTDGFTYTLPSYLFQQGSFSIGTSFGGFSIGAGASYMAGIKGGITLGLGEYTPNYPLTFNPGIAPAVQDGYTFAVEPQLVSANDAGFSLALPNANANLDFGLEAKAFLNASLPSIQIGVDIPFIGFVGTTFSLGSINETETVGSIYNLPSSTSVDVPGGSITLAELQNSTISTGNVSELGGLPTLTASGDTAPFLTGSVDLVALLAKYIPDLKAISGSDGFDIGSYSYDLLSAPFEASLGLSSSVTLTPIGITVTAVDASSGQTFTGPLGTEFDFAAPSSGSGIIPITETFALAVDVSSTVGLEGSLSLSIDGPSASFSIFGEGGSFGPLGSFNLFSYSGNIATLSSSNFTQTLTQTVTEDIHYQENQVVVPFAGTVSNGLFANSGNEEFIVEPGGKIFGINYGVESAHVGEVSIVNAGLISLSGTASGNGVTGIDLVQGGSVNNEAHGTITSTSGVGVGIYSATNFNGAVFNAGTVSGFATGIYVGEGSVTNAISGTIAPEAGISKPSHAGIGISVTNGATVINAGQIDATIGVQLGGNGGGAVYNSSTGTINSAGFGAFGTFAVYSQFGLTVVNRGLINGEISNGYPGQGGALHNGATAVVVNEVGGVINFNYSGGSGVYLQGSYTALENAGTIIGGVILDGSVVNTLKIAPTSVFKSSSQGGNVGVLAANGSGQTNIIDLLAGSTTGTCSLSSGNYANFNVLQIAQGASWNVLLDGYEREFPDRTVSGINHTDRITIEFLPAPFEKGDFVKLDRATDTLQFFAPGSPYNPLTQIDLTGTYRGACGFRILGYGEDSKGYNTVTFTNIVGSGQPNSLVDAPIGGITISAGGYYSTSLTVGSTGTISSTYYNNASLNTAAAITATNPLAVSITNYGTISGTQQGVVLDHSGVVSNKVGGVISGGAGVYITGTLPGQVLNRGVIDGLGGDGIYAKTDLFVRNYAYGTITGTTYGITTALAQTGSSGVHGNTVSGTIAGSVAVVYNCGTIIARTGIDLANLAAVYNCVGADINATNAGIILNTGSLINFGTIKATASAGQTGIGVALDGAAVILNSNTIFGSTYGVKLVDAATTLHNAGTITSAGKYGLDIAAATVTTAPYINNQGLISGIDAGNYASITNSGKIVNAGTFSSYGVGSRTGIGILAGAAPGVGAAEIIIVNSGNIDGAVAGISLEDGGTITNNAGGRISAYDGGGGEGVILSNGGVITNQAGALITGGIEAINVAPASGKTAAAMINNSGLIHGHATGIAFNGAGTIYNAHGAQISGESYAITSGATTGLVVTNAGTIAAYGLAVALHSGDSLINLAGGDIDGGYGGVALSGTATVLRNGGTISGGAAAVALLGTADNTLEIDAGAVFDGSVAARAGATNEILLDNGARVGTLSGLGSQFTGFTNLAEAGGADWVLHGNNSFGGNVALNGTLTLAGALTGAGTLTAASLLNGTGTIGLTVQDAGTIEASTGTLLLTGALTGAGALTAASGATLELGGGGTLAGTISGGGTLALKGTQGFTLSSGHAVSVGHIVIDAGATLSGSGASNSAIADAGTLVASAGVLALSGAVSGKGALQASRGATLELLAASSLTEAISGLGTLQLVNAVFTHMDEAAFTIGAVSIGSGAALEGYGTITSAISDGGTLEASGGTLVVSAAVSGGGGLVAAAGAVLDLASGGALSLAVSGGGTLELGAGSFTLGAAKIAPNTLDIAAAASLSGAVTTTISSVLVNHGTIATTGGSLSFLGAITNDGVANAGAGVLVLKGDVAGTGTLDVGQTGTLSLLGGSAATEVVHFTGAGGLLDLTTPSNFLGTIAGFAAGTVVDLIYTAANAFTYSNGTLSLTEKGAAVVSLHFSGNYTAADFALSNDGHSGTDIKFV